VCFLRAVWALGRLARPGRGARPGVPRRDPGPGVGPRSLRLAVWALAGASCWPCPTPRLRVRLLLAGAVPGCLGVLGGAAFVIGWFWWVALALPLPGGLLGGPSWLPLLFFSGFCGLCVFFFFFFFFCVFFFFFFLLFFCVLVFFFFFFFWGGLFFWGCSRIYLHCACELVVGIVVVPLYFRWLYRAFAGLFRVLDPNRMCLRIIVVFPLPGRS